MLSTLIALVAAAACPGSLDDDWPEFLGPNRTGTVGSVGSSFDWGEDGPDIAWRVEIGPGYGGVAIQGDEVFLFDREDGERDVLRVFALESGEELWSAGYTAPGKLMFPGSRTVPSVQGDLVTTFGGFGHVAVFDRSAKELDWFVDLEADYGGISPTFGWSSPPLVYDGLVIVPVLGEEVGLVAFELESGAEIWTTPDLGRSHSTPTLVELLGKKQVLFLSTQQEGRGNDEPGPMSITSFDPDSGKQLWQHQITLTRLPIPGPVQIDDERFFVTGGYKGGSTLMKIGRDGDDYTFEELFHIERGAQIHRPILHGEHLYMLPNENWNDSKRRQVEGGLMCLSLEGEELWRTKDDPYFGRGNALLAGDHLLIQDGHNGILRVVRATPEGYDLVAEADVFGEDDLERDGQMWAPMALSGKRLLMRSQDALLCVEL